MPIIVYITQGNLLARSVPNFVNITLAHLYLARGSTKPHDTYKATRTKTVRLI